VVHIEKKFNIKTTKYGLHKFYKKHNIKLLRGDYMYKQGLSSREDNKELRTKFCVQLLRLTREEELLCYMDESSFNMWCRMKKAWMGPKREDKVFLVVPPQRHSKTIVGCIGTFLPNGIFYTYEQGTTNEGTERFLRSLRKICDEQNVPAEKPIYMVLDNARAHTSASTK
jgi:hypothetical protein